MLVGEAVSPRPEEKRPRHTHTHTRHPQETQTESQDAQADAPQRPVTAQARTRHPQTDPPTDTRAGTHLPARVSPACTSRSRPAAGCGFLGNAVTVAASQSPEGLQHVPDEPLRAYLELRLHVGARQRPMRCPVGGRAPGAGDRP